MSNLRNGVYARADKPVLVVPSVEYAGLVDAMFHMIRQNAAGKPSVIIRILEILTAVVSCEHDLVRVVALQRHADLALVAAEHDVTAPADLEAVRTSHETFAATQPNLAWPRGEVERCIETRLEPRPSLRRSIGQANVFPNRNVQGLQENSQ